MLTKIRVIAFREYLSAVRTKGFIIGVILMPLLMGGGIVLQNLTKDIIDLSPRNVAVIDRTEDQQLFPALERAADRRNQTKIRDKDGKQTKPRFTFERVDVAGDLQQTRLDLSNRVRDGSLFAILEIGPDVLDPKAATPTTNPTDLQNQRDPFALIESTNDPDSLVYYSSNRPTYIELREFIQQTLQPRIAAARLKQSQATLDAVMRLFGTLVVPRGLASQDESGAITFEPRQNEIVLVVLPIVMTMTMLVVVLVGASPLTTNIIEEKQLRIGEVLLGSVTPFQLMMGKLLGGVGTSLTLGVIYIVGAIVGAHQLGVLHLVSPGLIAWFVVFTIVASLMYGSMFVVAGAAATNIKEAQALVTPMMLIVVLPMFLIGPMINEPHGAIATAGTFFPLSAPMVTMFRLAVPPMMPWWQIVIAIAGSGLMMIALVWVAGRVFRAGFLLVGRPASIRELIGWIIRG
jgi:ABC-2 type transport system permease protein